MFCIAFAVWAVVSYRAGKYRSRITPGRNQALCETETERDRNLR